MSTLLIVSSLIEKSVLILLVGLSVWSIAIIIDRYRSIFKEIDLKRFDEVAKALAEKGWGELESKASEDDDLLSGTIRLLSSLKGQDSEKIDRAVRSHLYSHRLVLEKGFTALATMGSNAPFIGLFGTVLGIIQAFAALSDSNMSSGAVMAGISGALIATAAGLFVAIPAVVAYNVFGRRLQVILSRCESLRDQFIASSGRPAT